MVQIDKFFFFDKLKKADSSTYKIVQVQVSVRKIRHLQGNGSQVYQFSGLISFGHQIMVFVADGSKWVGPSTILRCQA